MSSKIVTSDLSEFGYIEYEEASKLLKTYCEGDVLTHGLYDGVKLFFNKNSGNVFLSDEDFNTAMMNGDTLEKWFNCGNCGFEGFKEDFNTYEDDGDHSIRCPECDMEI